MMHAVRWSDDELKVLHESATADEAVAALASNRKRRAVTRKFHAEKRYLKKHLSNAPSNLFDVVLGPGKSVLRFSQLAPLPPSTTKIVKRVVIGNATGADFAFINAKINPGRTHAHAHAHAHGRAGNGEGGDVCHILTGPVVVVPTHTN